MLFPVVSIYTEVCHSLHSILFCCQVSASVLGQYFCDNCCPLSSFLINVGILHISLLQVSTSVVMCVILIASRADCNIVSTPAVN